MGAEKAMPENKNMPSLIDSAETFIIAKNYIVCANKTSIFVGETNISPFLREGWIFAEQKDGMRDMQIMKFAETSPRVRVVEDADPYKHRGFICANGISCSGRRGAVPYKHRGFVCIRDPSTTSPVSF